MIQILDLLEDIGVRPKTSGKNVSSGWAEIQCPFPECGDPSQHCGINLQTGAYNCWICGEKGSIVKLVKTILSTSYSEARKTIEKFSDEIIYTPPENNPNSRSMDRNIIPKEASFSLPQLHRNYLIGRNFDPDQIQKDYKIMSCYETGNYSYRLIIPVIIDGITVNFTARDVTGLQDTKYKNCKNDDAILSMKECLYNVDSIKNKAIICEGVTDVWRIGKGSVATMGVEYTSTQLAMLSRKEPKEIYILYDSDAIKKAEKLSMAVSTFCSKVEILELERGDPADMTREEAITLRKEIGI